MIMDKKNTDKLELNKILSLASSYAVLDGTKDFLLALKPLTDVSSVKDSLRLTDEATCLLFRYGVGRIEYFPPQEDSLERAFKGAALTCGELLNGAALLRSARICYSGISSSEDENIVKTRSLAENLFYDESLEKDIGAKILSETEVSDYASDKLYSIRSEIRSLNERIRSRLQEYLTGDEGKFLQDNIITMRDDRYVLPVKTEYKRSVKGFIHDRSQSGGTVFIEPEYVLEMNNELKSLHIDEKEEVERILSELSRRLGFNYKKLICDIKILIEIDSYFARAEYGYKLKCVKPEVNGKGIIKINRGRHPLIAQDSVVPVSLELGENYSFLLISGPNTGGKTVTLKMVGLFCLMAACGMFIPAAEGSEVSVFDDVSCDIGDAQSIEESLSTFSSHISNIVKIVDNAGAGSLVLIDELGGGTDPEEGEAIARAVLSFLLKSGAKGIVTTHFTSLKEYAYSADGVENASMEFDSATLRPLYRIKIGLPGSSNAIAISRRLGLKEEILSEALENMSDGAKNFENIVRSAEDIRIKAQREFEEAQGVKNEWQTKLSSLDLEREKFEKQKEKFFSNAKIEARRIVNEKTAEAEQLLGEIEEIFNKEEVSESDLIKARTLKNKLADKAYDSEREEYLKPQYVPLKDGKVSVGDNVYVSSFGAEAVVLELNERKKQVFVQIGNLKVWCKTSDLLAVVGRDSIEKKTVKKQKKENISVTRNLDREKLPVREINLLGMTVQEATLELDNFIDSALVSGFDEVKIVHGFGTGKLRDGVREYLRKNKRVAEFRPGKYGEGEGGVTIVKLK